MADNLRALHLYRRDGFHVEGLLRQAPARDGAVIDEYYMGKLLPQQATEPAANRKPGATGL